MSLCMCCLNRQYVGHSPTAEHKRHANTIIVLKGKHINSTILRWSNNGLCRPILYMGFECENMPLSLKPCDVIFNSYANKFNLPIKVVRDKQRMNTIKHNVHDIIKLQLWFLSMCGYYCNFCNNS